MVPAPNGGNAGHQPDTSVNKLEVAIAQAMQRLFEAHGSCTVREIREELISQGFSQVEASSNLITPRVRENITIGRLVREGTRHSQDTGKRYYPTKKWSSNPRVKRLLKQVSNPEPQKEESDMATINPAPAAVGVSDPQSQPTPEELKELQGKVAQYAALNKVWKEHLPEREFSEATLLQLIQAAAHYRQLAEQRQDERDQQAIDAEAAKKTPTKKKIPVWGWLVIALVGAALAIGGTFGVTRMAYKTSAKPRETQSQKSDVDYSRIKQLLEEEK
ncbi:MAG: hypothetical protein WD200_01790 [Candidatus Andersenbacteria bacterium]